MNAKETQLKRFLDGAKSFRIPLFQRTYNWNKKHWETLWEDIIEIYEENPNRRHFMGSVVSKELKSGPESVSLYLIIDGQQRLITLSILLAALSNIANNKDQELSDEINELYLKNKLASGLDVYKVLPTQADRKAFFPIIDHEGQGEMHSNINKVYMYFKKKIQTTTNGEKLNLIKLKNVILNGLELVSISLDESDDEYLIFESLNGKGEPLTQADLIRNYFFMKIEHNKQDEAYSKYWLPMQDSLGNHLEDFFKYQLLSIKGVFIRKNEVYQLWKERLCKLTSDKLMIELETLKYDCNLFLRLVLPETESVKSISKRISRLNRWGAETIYSFLLNVYRDFDKGKIDEQAFNEILLIIESFLVRRFFVNVSTKTLNRLFIRLYFQRPEGLTLAEGVKEILSEGSRKWPDDEAFREAVRTFHFYNNGKAEQRKMILESFELAFGHKEMPDFSKLTIEHILPQKLTSEWGEYLDLKNPSLKEANEKTLESLIHTIGNLTLSAYNPELSNKIYEKKRELLQTSNLEMNKEIAKETEWKFKQIEERANLLSKLALEIWPEPLTKNRPLVI